LSIYIFNLDSELVGSDAIITSQNIAIDWSKIWLFSGWFLLLT
jgi:hypothetical protein